MAEGCWVQEKDRKGEKEEKMKMVDSDGDESCTRKEGVWLVVSPELVVQLMVVDPLAQPLRTSERCFQRK